MERIRGRPPGPNGAAYRANLAFQGVINIITRSHARTESGSTDHAAGRAIREAHGLARRGSAANGGRTRCQLAESPRRHDTPRTTSCTLSMETRRKDRTYALPICGVNTTDPCRTELRLQAGATTGLDLSGAAWDLGQPRSRGRMDQSDYLWQLGLDPRPQRRNRNSRWNTITGDHGSRRSWIVPYGRRRCAHRSGPGESPRRYRRNCSSAHRLSPTRCSTSMTGHARGAPDSTTSMRAISGAGQDVRRHPV